MEKRLYFILGDLFVNAIAEPIAEYVKREAQPSTGNASSFSR